MLAELVNTGIVELAPLPMEITGEDVEIITPLGEMAKNVPLVKPAR